ncbi:hypothetical protein DVK00_20315 [Haloarcula sp. Atlit-47R]|uniref:substrate-binding domain-containing protein n=1 Tax=Haloarcula sp. Atlit-47R TaxID=2282132 RepID=UPI000EF202E9|nr:hypothetical protein [Haloarcula sp. Atlit-47R]RLM41331.1 hypothetical protein DVK00_20315 [Haloarcula sp. Atlit-47R]
MPSRRAFLRGVAALCPPGLSAGCTGIFGRDRPTERYSTTDRADRSATASATPTETETTAEPLNIATVALTGPVARAATLWNGNPLPTDDEYGRSLADTLGSDGPGLAGYFGRQHGLSPTRQALSPPFEITVASATQTDARDALATGSISIAGLGTEAYAPIDSELDLSGFVRHDLFRAGTVIVVSTALYDSGVTSITRADLLGIYNGRLDNWASLGGPAREIHLAGTVDVQGGPEIFKETVLAGQPRGGADELFGQVDRKVDTVSDRDDTITRIPVRDVRSLRDGGTTDYRILQIEVDGEPRGPGDIGYPATYPVPLFTTGAPGPREAAFLDALSADALQPEILDSDGRLHVLPTGADPNY